MDMLPDWEKLYRKEKVETLPWYSPSLDSDLKGALERERREKAILTLGEGPGTQAIELAKMGYKVTSTDISASAVKQARKRAAREGARVGFIVDDILHTRLKVKFPLVFDRGCFHVIEPRLRDRYVRNVYNLLSPGGLLFLKTFSWKEKGPGPYRFRPEEIRAIFKGKFSVESFKETRFEGTLDSLPKALFFVMKRS